ncbi:MAG TPA: condensation domain-containing protein [Streptosporangiaceae bacterium]|nr:condensation domain-containing protein [Streptosporangiaceae bacterium]
MNEAPARPEHQAMAADRLRKRIRWQRSSPRPPGLKVALLATFTADPVVPFLGVALDDAGIAADVWVAPYGQIAQQLLDGGSAMASYRPDVVVVAPRLEELWAATPLPVAGPAHPYETDLRYLAEASIRAVRQSTAHLVFVLPAIPDVRPAGVGDDGNPAGVTAVATQAREGARQALASEPGLSVVDADMLVRSLGSPQAYRPALQMTAQIPFSEEYFDHLGQRIARAIVLWRQPAPPLLLIDGAALVHSRAEHAVEGRGTASAFTHLGHYLAETHRLGATVAVCGATEDVRAGLADMAPFAVWRPEGTDRAVDVGKAVADLAGPDRRVTFLSTDAPAIEAVRRECPAVTLLLLPPAPEQWVASLNRTGAVDQAPPGMGRASHAEAVAAGQPSLTLDSFLEHLGLEVVCEPLRAGDTQVASDLTRTVSEFHMDGEVWEPERLAGCIASDPGLCRGISVRDRFGDYGLAGLAVMHPSGQALAVDLWVLTCPVLGKGVEAQVLAALRELARARGCTALTFTYRPTPRNGAFREFLTRLHPAALAQDGPPVVEVGLASLDQRPSATPPSQQLRAAAAPPWRPPTALATTTGQFTSAAQILHAVNSRLRPVAGADRPEARAGQPGDGRPPRTDAERLLARLFAERLQRPVADVDTNFFNVGGDSMMAVALIADASQAGLRFTLPQVFRHQTVAELAAVATSAVTVDTRTEVVRSAPLLPGHAWFFGLNLPRPSHFNQSLRFQVPPDVDADALEQAAAAVVARHPALRMHFAASDDGWCQVDAGPPETAPFTHVDLRGLSAEERAARTARHEAELQRGMSLPDGVLARFALFTVDPPGPSVLFVVFHHLAIDGVSWRIVLDDLQAAYQAARSGSAVVSDGSGASILAWSRRLYEYAQTPAVSEELGEWLSQRRQHVEPLPVDNETAISSRTAFTHHDGTYLDAAQTQALTRQAVNVHHVSLDILLLTGVLLTLGRWTGQARHLIDVVNHGRDALLDSDVSGTVGWLSMNVPAVFEVDGSLPAHAAVADVDRQLRHSSGPHGAGDNLLRYLSQDAEVRRRLRTLPAADALFSYAGRFGRSGTHGALLGPVVEGPGDDMDSGAATPYVLQFDTIVLGDQVRLDIYYRTTQYDPATVGDLLDGWVRALRELAAGGSASGMDRGAPNSEGQQP